MKVVVRFQINTKLERVKNLKEFNNLPKVTFLPYFWFESSMEMPHEYAGKLWYFSNFKIIVISIGAILSGIGVGLLIYGYSKCMKPISTSYFTIQGGSGLETTFILDEQNELLTIPE